MNSTARPIQSIRSPDGRIVIRDWGKVLPVETTIADWARWNGCNREASPNAVASDATPSLSVRDFVGCRGGVRVRLYEIIGGGHTWPGGPQYLPERLIGPATHVVDASQTIGAIATGRF